MTSVSVLDPTGKKAGQAELPAGVFDVVVNVPLIHQVVVAQLAAARQGTHATKTRGMVRGGGRKPYKQKGTGRARQGSTRAPQFAGGGVVHGPQPRDYTQRTPKKMKAAALRGALSDRARADRVHVVTGFGVDGTPSTKTAVATLAKITERPNVLVVVDRNDEATILSLRNVAAVHLIYPDQLNTYDVLVNDDVVFTKAALAEFLAGPIAAVAEPAETPVVEAEPVVEEPVVEAPKAKKAKPVVEPVETTQPEKPAKADKPKAKKADADEPKAEKPAKADKPKAEKKSVVEPVETTDAKPAKKEASK